MQTNIGESYPLSIGRSYTEDGQTFQMPNRTVWERVQEALQDAQYEGKQHELRKLLGIQQGSVSDWNKPGKGPKLAHAMELARKLNICVEWIYTGRGPKRPVPPDIAADELWSAWQRLTDVARGRVLQVAIGLAEERPTSRARQKPAA